MFLGRKGEEKYIRNFFVKVKNKYKLSGLFDVDIYVNDYYGMIIEINNLCFYRGEDEVKKIKRWIG